MVLLVLPGNSHKLAAMAARHRGSRTATALQQAKSHKADGKPAVKNKTRKRLLSLVTIVLVVLALYSTPAVLVRYSEWLQKALIFVHHVRTPFYGNLSDPGSYGLKFARQFELFHEDQCGVEVWQVLPRVYHDGDEVNMDIALSESDFQSALSDGAPVVLYLHGNTGTRALYHRVEVYKYLSGEKGFHVVTFDYRGFGNSQCHPSERGMMEDALLVWKWVRTHAPDSKIYIWGHSLGSAAATYLTKELCDSGEQPSGMILDAPFTDVLDAAENHPITLPYWPIIPLFRYYILETLEERFESVQRLKDITCPVLILHGRNDIIIPFHIGEKFYNTVLEFKKDHPSMGSVEFVDCGETNHKENYLSPHTHSALDRFIQRH